MPDLELATTQQLVDELRSRFPRGVIVTAVGGDENEGDAFHLWYHGGITMGIGLCHRAARTLELDAVCDPEEHEEQDDQ